jgi:hypothetical protein
VLALLAAKYQLDPLLNEVAVIGTKQGLRPYITRDGMLTIAHRSGQFDGITTDELREGEHGWAATVTVWRKDMSHGFTYSAGCGRSEPQAAQGHGAEMALARAERRALRRAFNIPTSEEEAEEAGNWPRSPAGEMAPPEEVGTSPSPPAVSTDVPMLTREQTREITALVTELGLAGREQRGPMLAYLSTILGREVETTGSLTEAEGEILLEVFRDDVAAMREAEPIDTVAEEEPPL